jgi:hypothetical protein
MPRPCANLSFPDGRKRGYGTNGNNGTAVEARTEALETKARGEKMIAETIAEENAKTAAAEQELKRSRLEAESIRARRR